MISFVDSCPPYIYIEGLLEGKEVLDDNEKDDEKTVIYISSKRVEVDPYTFGILMIGLFAIVLNIAIAEVLRLGLSIESHLYDIREKSNR